MTEPVLQGGAILHETCWFACFTPWAHPTKAQPKDRLRVCTALRPCPALSGQSPNPPCPRCPPPSCFPWSNPAGCATVLPGPASACTWCTLHWHRRAGQGAACEISVCWLPPQACPPAPKGNAHCASPPPRTPTHLTVCLYVLGVVQEPAGVWSDRPCAWGGEGGRLGHGPACWAHAEWPTPQPTPQSSCLPEQPATFAHLPGSPSGRQPQWGASPGPDVHLFDRVVGALPSLQRSTPAPPHPAVQLSLLSISRRGWFAGARGLCCLLNPTRG